MATQWTAGTTSGQVLTAATLNTIGAEWETWTPTVTATGGTITTGTVTLARYARIQKLVFVQFGFSITTAGSAAGQSLVTTLPVTPSTAIPTGNMIGQGREYISVGFMLEVVKTSATQVSIFDYTGASWIQSNRGCYVTMCYEAA